MQIYLYSNKQIDEVPILVEPIFCQARQVTNMSVWSVLRKMKQSKGTPDEGGVLAALFRARTEGLSKVIVEGV